MIRCASASAWSSKAKRCAVSRSDRTAATRLSVISVGAAIAVGAVAGFVLGIVVGTLTDLPLMPELGAVLGGLIVLYLRRDELREDR